MNKKKMLSRACWDEIFSGTANNKESLGRSIAGSLLWSSGHHATEQKQDRKKTEQLYLAVDLRNNLCFSFKYLESQNKENEGEGKTNKQKALSILYS